MNTKESWAIWPINTAFQITHASWMLVKLNAEFVSPVRFTRPVCRDKDDDKFLSAALGGNAPFLVSGDNDLLAVDGFKGIRVLKAKAFLAELR